MGRAQRRGKETMRAWCLCTSTIFMENINSISPLHALASVRLYAENHNVNFVDLWTLLCSLRVLSMAEYSYNRRDEKENANVCVLSNWVNKFALNISVADIQAHEMKTLFYAISRLQMVADNVSQAALSSKDIHSDSHGAEWTKIGMLHNN